MPRVQHLLAVLDAVPGVEERRRGREDVCVERGSGRDRLEGRARRIEALRRAVQERGRGAGARGRRVQDLRVAGVGLDPVRVVRRRRGHHLDGAGLRVEDDRGAAFAGEQRLGQALRAGLDVEDDVVAGDRRPAQAVAELVDDRAEVRVGRRQIGVLGALEAGARPALRRVADDLRGKAAGPVAAEVERLAGDLLLDVRGEDGPAVRGQDQAALDPELRDPLDRVVLLRRQAAGRPRLPVRRARRSATRAAAAR